MKAPDFSKEGFLTQEQFEFPQIVNLCVLRGPCPCECVHCPVGVTPKEKRGAHFGFEAMKLDLFKKIVDEASMHPSSALRIHAVGEPLLWQDLSDALKYAYKKKVKTWIFTCAVTKDKGLLEVLAKCCSIIEVSVNSTDAEDYKHTKGIDEFILVNDNIKLLSSIIKKSNSKAKLLATRVESTDKEYDSSFVDYWLRSGLVDDSFVRSYHNYNNAIANKFGTKPRDCAPCLVHWARFNVDCSGEVVICFNELFKGKRAKKEVVLGDLNNSSVKNVWHGEKLTLIRKAQLIGNYNMANFTESIPCKSCVSCQPLDTAKVTSEHQLRRLEC